MLLVLFSTDALCQGYVGVLGGLRYAGISASGFSSGSGPRIGCSGGFAYQQFVSGGGFYGIDLLYDQRGFTNDIVRAAPEITNAGRRLLFEYSYDYLSLPMKAGFETGNKARPFGDLGIVPAFLLRAQTAFPSYNQNGTAFPARTSDITDRLNRFDVACIAEIGLMVAISDQVMLLGAINYQQSVTSITRDRYFYFADSKLRHSGWLFSLGLMYSVSQRGHQVP